MIKPKIVVSKISKDGKLLELNLKVVVRKIGNSGYVTVPKELIGKYVEIIYKK